MADHSIPTKAELLAHIEDRDNDLSKAKQALTPPWIETRENDDWKHIRERERKIDRLTTRLDKAKTKLDQNWDDRAYDLEP